MHSDINTKCCINIILSKDSAPIVFEDIGEVTYKCALLNITKRHMVPAFHLERLLLKFSIFDKTYEEARLSLKKLSFKGLNMRRCVLVSGGQDSRILHHMLRLEYPDIISVNIRKPKNMDVFENVDVIIKHIKKGDSTYTGTLYTVEKKLIPFMMK